MCGGIGFVKAVRSPLAGRRSSLHLYFGNRCGLYRLTPSRIAGTNRFDYSGTWTAAMLDHGDTRDLAFKRTGRFVRPLLLGTDGGVHRTTDGGSTWTFTGGGVNGYNALQITEVKGQWIEDIGRYDLYFGTQDNNNLASGDLGVTWPNAVCCEGFFFEMQKRVPTAGDTQVTFVACGPCSNFRSGPALAGNVSWTNPTGTVAGNPAMNGFGGLGINPTMFAWYQVFGVDPQDSRHIIAPDIINAKMMQTSDGGENWTEIPRPM